LTEIVVENTPEHTKDDIGIKNIRGSMPTIYL